MLTKKDIEESLVDVINCDLLIKDATIVSMSGVDSIFHHHSLGIKDGKIVYLGPFNDKLKANRTISGSNYVVTPGFYNCHSHMAMSLLRGISEDKRLQEWLNEDIFPTEDIMRDTSNCVYTGAMLAIAEMVASGTVSTTDMYFNMEETARAVLDSGIKANVSNAIVTFDEQFDYHSDNCYLQSESVLKKYKEAADGRIKVDAAIHAEYTSFPEAWEQVVSYAKSKDMNLQIHISETEREHIACIEKTGKTPTQYLYEHGVFDVNGTAAHCVHTNPDDWRILADNHVTVAHCPVSNLKLASGIAPVMDMINAGVNIALGTDGVASNNSYDMLEEAKLAGLLQKNKHSDPGVISSYDVLKMLTVNGAISQGRAHESGRIECGYDADIVIFDFDSPNLIPRFDIYTNIIYSANPRNIIYTICKGRVLYEKGEFTTIDYELISSSARNLVDNVLKKGG